MAALPRKRVGGDYMTSVTIRHNFETAHRLLGLGGKCQNLHGHSWWAEITVTGEPDAQGIVIDFGTLKKRLRDWIDTYLDHGAMLGQADPLVPALLAESSKLFQFGASEPSKGLEWPTVENVAELLARMTAEQIEESGWSGVSLSGVKVSETCTNAAEVTR
jgi:6-pyruvoyltetrahydropterin/6-carboxytetrahydropterin synthase